MNQKIIYKSSLPYSAQLCRISSQMPHRHETELELVYCLRGSLTLIAADQEYVLTAGQIHSIDFWDIHYLNGSDDNLTLLFHLDLSALKDWEELQYVFFACESNHCFPYQNHAMNTVKDIILSLSYLYFRNYTEYDSYCVSAIRNLKSTLLTYFNWFNYENNDEYMNVDLYNRFNRVLKYIIDNYKQKISVSQLAALEHINKNYFSQFISKTVFSSFSNMVNYIRCYNAEIMLLTTDLSVSDISFECGFSDPKYFYSAFKNLWHMTPTEDRKRYLTQSETAFLEKNSNAILSDDAAASELKDYITLWHIHRTLQVQ